MFIYFNDVMNKNFKNIFEKDDYVIISFNFYTFHKIIFTNRT